MDDISKDSSLFTEASIDPPRCPIDPQWEYTIRYWMVYGRKVGKDIDYLTANNPLFKDLIAKTGITSQYFACTNCETPEETSFVNTFYNTMLYLQGSAIRNRVADIFDAKNDVPLVMLLQDVNKATVRRVGDKVVPLQEEFAEVKNKMTPRDVTVETLLIETEAELEKIIEAKAVRIKLQDDNNAKKTQDLIDERWKSLRDLLRTLKEITDSTRKDVNDLQGEPREGEDPVTLEIILQAIQSAERAIRGDLSNISKILTETGVKVTHESMVGIAEEATLRVVGEAYKKWDSTSSYFPCLVFIFKERGIMAGARRTQIKGRLLKAGQDLTDQDIEELRKRVNQKALVTYEHGRIRGNYIATDKRWKSTIFGKDRATIIDILKYVCDCIGEPFVSDTLSFTDGPRRVSHTRRTNPLTDIQPYRDEYALEFSVELFKVSLLVNGLDHPIVLRTPAIK
jgi:hypothetical protein